MEQPVYTNLLDREAILAFGANIDSPVGPPEETLKKAMGALTDKGIRLLSASKLYRTPCVPAGAGPDFVNAIAIAEADMSCDMLLGVLHDIEKGLGRLRKARWSARTIDIDLIAMGTQVLPDANTLRHWIDLPFERQAQDAPSELLLPHPRLQDRAFVLIPLAELRPDWMHPVLGLSAAEMLSRLPEGDKSAIKPL